MGRDRIISDYLGASRICKSALKIFAAFLVVLSFFTGCSGRVSNDLSNEKNRMADESNRQNITQYVKIYTGNTDEDIFNFYYDLYDKSGNLIKHECTYMDEPDAAILSENIIRISVQTGTGLATRWTYYYNLDSGDFSQVFYYVLAEKDNYVAFFSDDKVIISDMFDENRIIKEVQPKKALSNCSDPIESITFSDDLSKINMTYLYGDEFQKIREVIPLN